VRAIGLDVGERRIGVALSDPTGVLASPHGVIQRESRAADFERIAGLVRETGAELVVVGLPLTLSGDTGPQARRVQRYTRALAEHLDVPVAFQDERFSTATADLRLQESGRRRKVAIDAAAAAVILQDYLDRVMSQRADVTSCGDEAG
jgi:putative holliday junction resolvase